MLVTLGTGKMVVRDLVAYHAYGVIGVSENEAGDRVLEVVDPGSTPRQSDGVLEESMVQLNLAPQHGEPSILRLEPYLTSTARAVFDRGCD